MVQPKGTKNGESHRLACRNFDRALPYLNPHQLVFPQSLEPFHLAWHLQCYCKTRQKLALNREYEYKQCTDEVNLKKKKKITGDQTQIKYKKKGKEVSSGYPRKQ